jgi:hypothetical protein
MAKDQSNPTNPRNDRPKDDNIDDLGRKPDGTTLDQPGAANSPNSGKQPSPGRQGRATDGQHRRPK